MPVVLPHQPAKPVEATARLAVILVCHPEYLPSLEHTCKTIRAAAQGLPVELILVLDGISKSAAPAGWHVLAGEWGNPNPARNLGTLTARQLLCQWAIYWDADDTMPFNYLVYMLAEIRQIGRLGPISPSEKVAILYPHVSRNGRPHPHTPWDYWDQRRLHRISTQSAWRLSALEQAGDWDEQSPMHDDANLAARVTALGWQAHATQIPLQLSTHGDNHRSQQPKALEALLRYRTLTILCLLDDTPGAQEDIAAWVKDQSDQSNLPDQSDLLFYRDKSPLTHLERRSARRHNHIASLYNLAFRRITSDWILTIEADVRPPDGAFRLLAGHMLPGSNVAAAAAAYPSATSPDWVCGSTDHNRWTCDIPWPVQSPGILHAGRVPGGFTLWANWALRKVLPADITADDQGNIIEGWDGCISRRLLREGHQLILDTRVQCKHLPVNP